MFTNGPMEESTTDSGATIRWKATECSPGPMAEDMKENISTIRSKAKECSSGPMEGATMETGSMESSMVLELTHLQLERRRRENGPKVRESTGSTEQRAPRREAKARCERQSNSP